MTDHPFDAAIALAPGADGLFDGATHPAWANMVGPFGGITAATLLNAAWRHPQRLGEPLSLTVNYAGPIAEGTFRIAATPVRTNRSTQHWSIALHQGDEVATTATAVFATRRDTWAAQERGAPRPPPADRVTVHAPQPGVTWSGRYEMRFVAGAWPVYDTDAPQDDSETALWVRDEPPRPLDALALAAICDVFYPRVFRRRARFAPAGTVSITTFFHADAAALAAQGARPVFARARAQRFVQGFHDQSAEVWGDDGSLLASSHQIVYYKA
jgi:acyl-CoA thioesterase